MKAPFFKYHSRWFGICIVIAVITIFGSSRSSEAIEKNYPFVPGEKLTYKLKWMFIPAGEAVLEVLPFETIDHVKSYHFLLTARSNAFIDHFYRVRDRIDAHANVQMTHSVLYKKDQQEGKRTKDVVVEFDWKKNKAIYSNFKQKRKPIDLLSGSFDPLSAFYYVRLIDLSENSVIERPVTDGKKCVIGKATVIRRETIQIASGKFDTYLIEPDLSHVSGVFEKSKDAKIQLWITADKRRIPVKIKSKVIVGTFVGELVSVTD
ncbi:MAG: DUF3108 domain-containing protein [Desulfobacterales bacterium]|nr:MAG: DUF3108 domain-containing protein [Desulfobacterales bacterium]